MTARLRNHIEKGIQELGPLDFQEFMLRLLPLHDKRYEGIIRNGHTDRKTHKGVPDLIKTFNNGEQIGCECGTAKQYWHLPKKGRNSGKPIEDLRKCLLKLERPIEIILASNQPMPRSDPNTKTKIISNNSNKDCKLTILSSEDLSSWIETNISQPKVNDLIKEFFPDIAMDRDLSDITNLITGGDSFCYLELHGIYNNIGTVLIHNPGKYMMQNIQMQIVDLNKIDVQNISEIQQLHAESVLRTDYRWNLGSSSERKFNIFWMAKNGNFIQPLRFKKVAENWLQATKITNLKNNEEIFLKKSLDFPTNKHGEIEWD